MDGEGRHHRGERGEGMGRDGDRGPRGEAGEKGRRGPRSRGDIAKRMFAGMDLTDEQKTEVKEILKAHGDERKAWHEEHQDEFQALREKMRDARGDQDAMEALRNEVHALMESAPKPDATHDQIRGLLNEEQQATFDERVTKMRERMAQWRENRKDGPPRGPGMGPDGDGPPHGRGMGPGSDGPPPPGAEGRGRRGPGGRLFGNIDLDDGQKAEMREIMQSDVTREEKMAAVREILTEEQQAKLDKNVEKMRKYREEHQGERGERGERPRRGDRGPRGDRPRRDGDAGSDEKLDL
jgi:periplasmic protein CpxP/Spy